MGLSAIQRPSAVKQQQSLFLPGSFSSLLLRNYYLYFYILLFLCIIFVYLYSSFIIFIGTLNFNLQFYILILKKNLSNSIFQAVSTENGGASYLNDLEAHLQKKLPWNYEWSVYGVGE